MRILQKFKWWEKEPEPEVARGVHSDVGGGDGVNGIGGRVRWKRVKKRRLTVPLELWERLMS